MTTSKVKAVLFTKQNCLPCTKTKDLIRQIISESPDLIDTVSVLQKENHSSLVEEYKLDKYPTLLLVDEEGEVIQRHIGGNHVRWVLPGIMSLLGANR